jgi:hypothetical protein
MSAGLVPEARAREIVREELAAMFSDAFDEIRPLDSTAAIADAIASIPPVASVSSALLGLAAQEQAVGQEVHYLADPSRATHSTQCQTAQSATTLPTQQAECTAEPASEDPETLRLFQRLRLSWTLAQDSVRVLAYRPTHAAGTSRSRRFSGRSLAVRRLATWFSPSFGADNQRVGDGPGPVGHAGPGHTQGGAQ